MATFPGIPVIPANLGSAAQAMPKGAFLPRPYTIHVRFGPPLYLQAQLDDRESWQDVADTVRAAVLELAVN